MVLLPTLNHCFVRSVVKTSKVRDITACPDTLLQRCIGFPGEVFFPNVHPEACKPRFGHCPLLHCLVLLSTTWLHHPCNHHSNSSRFQADTPLPSLCQINQFQHHQPLCVDHMVYAPVPWLLSAGSSCSFSIFAMNWEGWKMGTVVQLGHHHCWVYIEKECVCTRMLLCFYVTEDKIKKHLLFIKKVVNFGLALYL